MDFLLSEIIGYLLVYKYPMLFAITFLAALALPIPSAAPLMAASAFAGQGYFSFSLVLLSAYAGNVLGDNTGYWLARLFGAQVLRKLGFKKYIDAPVFISLERHINKRPALIIILTRFEVIVTITVNLLAGLGKMPYKKYLTYDLIGEALQVGTYASLGYIFGSQWQAAHTVIGRILLVTTLLGAVLVMVLWKRINRHLLKHQRP